MVNADGGVRTVPVSLSGHVTVEADVAVPDAAQAAILIIPRDPRQDPIAAALQAAGFATIHADLLTTEERVVDALTGARRFDIALLAARAVALIDWVENHPPTAGLPIGLFASGPTAAAALTAAADQPASVRAVVAYEGRPDLAGPALHWVEQPTLLIVNDVDEAVFELNRRAILDIPAEVRLEIVPTGEDTADDTADPAPTANLACAWFSEKARPPPTAGT